MKVLGLENFQLYCTAHLGVEGRGGGGGGGGSE